MESIESSILKGLLTNDEYVSKVYPHLDIQFFEGTSKTVFFIFSELYDKYKTVPTKEAIQLTAKTIGLKQKEYADTVDCISDLYKLHNENPTLNVEWLVKETESYCQQKALYDGIYQAANILSGDEKKIDKSAIPSILENALAISFDRNIGCDYFDSAKDRYLHYTSEEELIKFPLPELNELSNGGLRKKTLSCLLAGTGVGKSAMMCYLAGEWLKMGYNVLYITLEMSEYQVQERIDANLMNVPIDELKKLSEKEFMSKMDSIQNKTNGRFVTKQYPTSSAHTGHFKVLLKELQQKQGFVPDIIIGDYINISASARYKSLAGVNSYSLVKAIAEEWRALAVEYNVPFLTATQVNRDSMNSTAPDMTSTSESFGLPMSLDLFIAIVTDESLQEQKEQILHCLKSRFGDKSRVSSMRVGIDFSLMRYYSKMPGLSEEVHVPVSELSNNVKKTLERLEETTTDWGA